MWFLSSFLVWRGRRSTMPLSRSLDLAIYQRQILHSLWYRVSTDTLCPFLYKYPRCGRDRYPLPSTTNISRLFSPLPHNIFCQLLLCSSYCHILFTCKSLSASIPSIPHPPLSSVDHGSTSTGASANPNAGGVLRRRYQCPSEASAGGNISRLSFQARVIYGFSGTKVGPRYPLAQNNACTN